MSESIYLIDFLSELDSKIHPESYDCAQNYNAVLYTAGYT